MKFQAKHVTLKIEIVQLDSKERELSVPPLNAQKAANLLDRLIEEDEKFDSSHEKNKPIYTELSAHYARQLADIYGTEASYWSDNVDGTTIADVKRYVIDELLGVRKKD